MGLREKKCEHGFYALEACEECMRQRIAELEAEVERLRAERDFWKKGIETHPWTKPGDMEKHQAAFEMIYAAFKEASP